MVKEKKELTQVQEEAKAHNAVLKEWGDARDENEQFIYAQGYKGNIICSAICGKSIEITSLLYDLMENVTEQLGVDFMSTLIAFTHIYHVRQAKKDKTPEEKPEDVTQTESPE